MMDEKEKTKLNDLYRQKCLELGETRYLLEYYDLKVKELIKAIAKLHKKSNDEQKVEKKDE